MPAGRDLVVKQAALGISLVTLVFAIAMSANYSVDKAGFQTIADPYLDKLARDLGPHADKIKTLIRGVN